MLDPYCCILAWNSYLNGHANANEDQRAFDLVGALKSLGDPLPSAIGNVLSRLLVDWRMVFERTHAGKLLLSTSDV